MLQSIKQRTGDILTWNEDGMYYRGLYFDLCNANLCLDCSVVEQINRALKQLQCEQDLHSVILQHPLFSGIPTSIDDFRSLPIPISTTEEHHLRKVSRRRLQPYSTRCIHISSRTNKWPHPRPLHLLVNDSRSTHIH